MKKIILLLFPCIAFISACNKDVEEPSTEEITYNVRLNFGGEINAFDSPLTKAGESDALFGIWIGKDGSKYNNKFGGGLFDNTDNIIVSFISGHTYTVYCTLVSNGKAIVSHSSGSSPQYGPPFNYSNNTAAYVTNKLFYWNNVTGDTMFGNWTVMHREGYEFGITKPFNRRADRYFWKVTDYTPTENGTLNVELKHTVMGVKYRIAGLVDGSIALTVRIGEETIISESAISSNGEGVGSVFECCDIVSAFDHPNTYKETATVSIVWNRGIGVAQNLGSISVDLLRNRMNVININLGADDGGASLGINVDQTDMTNESVTIEAS